MFYLQPLSPADGREVYDMLQRIPPENGFENSAYTMDYGDFPAWLAKKADMARGIGLEDWMVPSSTFWLMDLLNSGVTAKQMTRERMMQITPITVRFLKKLIISSILCAFHNTNRYG